MVASMISRSSGLSLYRQVADDLRLKMLDGTYGPGSQLPSEKYLAEEYEVGRDTIRDAMAYLRQQGLITSSRGYRSRVVEEPPRERVWLRSGETATARMPTPEERQELGVREGVPVFVVGEQIYPADRFEFYAE